MLSIREVSADETDDPRLLPLGAEIVSYYKQSGTLIEIDIGVTLKTLKSLLSVGIAVFLVLEDDGEPIGFICGGCCPDLLCNRIIATETFWYIQKDRRHHGLGDMLIRAFEMWARSRGASRIRLAHLVDLRADENRRLYEGLGFKACEVAYEKEV